MKKRAFRKNDFFLTPSFLKEKQTPIAQILRVYLTKMSKIHKQSVKHIAANDNRSQFGSSFVQTSVDNRWKRSGGMRTFEGILDTTTKIFMHLKIFNYHKSLFEQN